MINLYSGTPGSGKSLHIAKDIYDYCKSYKNRLIIVNFEVDLEKLKHPERVIIIDNSQLKTPDFILELCKNFNYENGLKEGNIILFIDECQLIFNARSWNEDGRKEWLSFFTQHRKLGCNVYLVSQFDMMIDKQIRSLIEFETIHRKITNFGYFGLFLKLFFLGHDVFTSVEVWYALKQRTDFSFFINKKKYYSLYDTFNTFDSKELEI